MSLKWKETVRQHLYNHLFHPNQSADGIGDTDKCENTETTSHALSLKQHGYEYMVGCFFLLTSLAGLSASDI